MLIPLIFLSLANAAILKDLVTSLPGVPVVPSFDIYSGYLAIPNSKGKSLHYIFIESQNSPSTDPLLLWLNGGPGCSSLEGLFYENGPFIFTDTNRTSLSPNPYSWNTNASVIYLESPAGVGFSLMGDPSNNYTTDQITAHDNLMALLQFFRGFYEYRGNDFYISGESYAGIYVPTLALQIVNYNSYTPYAPINLQGIAVGNGCTDWTVDTTPAFMHLLWTYGMIDEYWHAQLMENCGGMRDFSSGICLYVCYQISAGVVGMVNVYDVYGECYQGTGEGEGRRTNKDNLRFLRDVNPALGEAVACIDNSGAYSYLGSKVVRQALNIPPSANDWESCSNIDYQTDFYHGSFYTYPTLINAGLNILIYSGDVDGAVPTIGTRMWIRNLNLAILEPYRSWIVNEQVAGYTIGYRGLRLVTVKGSGHMVPQWKPVQAHHMLLSWLQGTKI